MTLKELLYNIVFQPAYAAALEIEDSVLRIGHAAPKRGTITLVHEHKLREGVVENGEILNEREFGGELSDAIAASGLKSTYYVTHAPARHTALRLLQLPPMPARELRDAVRYEAARNLPYNLTDAAIGYSPLNNVIAPKHTKATKAIKNPLGSLLKRRKAPATDTQEPDTQQPEADPTTNSSEPEKAKPKGKNAGEPSQQLVAATPNAHVLTLMRVARLVGVRLGVVEPKPLASLRALKHHKLITPNDLILDIHTHHAHINAITNGSLKLNRLLSYTRQDLKEDTSEKLIEGLTRDVTSTLEYLTRIDPSIMMNRILIAGGTLSEPLAALIKDLGLNIEYATIDTHPPEHNTIIGLAIRGAEGI